MNSILPNNGSASNLRDMTESRRALELRKFFSPYQFSNSGNEDGFNSSLNNDGALDAYAETILWRLKAAHVMVSLVDKGTQYFLAGACRRPDDDDDETLIDDSTWFGCSTVPTPGGLCENTLALSESNTQYPCFVVPDLSKDERFSGLPVVDGQIASFRFYAGTPIVTHHGVNIGSLFLFDDEPRNGLSNQQAKFLHRQASNVMRHLETKREAAERRRVELMSRGTAQFLERTTLSHELSHDASRPPSETGFEADINSDSAQQTGAADGPSENATPLVEESVFDKIRLTLDYAADILRESLELQVGGVVFLDPTIGHSEIGYADAYSGFQGDGVEKRRPSSNDYFPNAKLTHSVYDEFGGVLSQSTIRSSADKHKPAKVLSMSAAKIATWDPESRVLDGKTLQTFINSYPNGNIWYIDEGGYFSSLEQVEDLHTNLRTRPTSRSRSMSPSQSAKQIAEAAMLSKIFHKAKQIIFLPLWDAGGDRWYAGCFVWSQSAVPVFTVNSEIAYLSSFTNSVMVEINRLDAITANKVKSDFISSISHEFRSPLHGILASVEFLRGSQLDTAQIEFISTIQNCGGTLLDTINHVLDYSKINSFEKNGEPRGSTGVSNELYQVTNLALLCEDLINGMIAANEYNTAPTRSGDLSIHISHQQQLRSQLAIILDIEGGDWEFTIQAGAIRRVVMNIFGNAQKYTSSGYILVRLRVQKESEDEGREASRRMKTLRLNIRDSGRGMSAEYMERKLYQPFAQEDTFAPGVGLGLSIVWSIVNQLGGKIHVRSDLGKGTDIEVTLPLETKRDLPEASYDANAETVYASTDAKELISQLRDHYSGQSISICRKASSEEPHRDIFWSCIEKYCEDWFGFRIMPSGGDILITDQHNASQHCHYPRVIVVHKGLISPIKRGRTQSLIADITCPVGPFKLAKVVLGLLNRQSERARPGSSKRTDAGTQTPARASQEHKILNEIILTDYRFPQKSIPDVLTSCSDNEPSSASEMAPKSLQEQIHQSNIESLQKLNLQPPAPSKKSRVETPRSLSPSLTTAPGMTPDPPFHNPSKQNTPPEPSPKGLHILAVDDNAVNLQLLKRYLQKRKCDTVATACNGIKAVQAYKDALNNPDEKLRTFDVIFMDISMPAMDGFEATRVIRRLEAENCQEKSADLEEHEILRGRETGSDRAHVVALTGLASRRDRDEAVRSGLDDFLTKPVSFAKIGELLKRLDKEKEAVFAGNQKGLGEESRNGNGDE
ncbi:M3EW, histidine kinase-group I protein [Amylocarpus encephaloides]|uniref:M3EW, histidine kinase-group I protein n=1 Tax=Amylocarpus encephaloides TaxID=45428 RepID=A0A9P8C7H5_9HELO|nr:M3EW, histidine kinase-group I protein [Amylocarpus encephaloides]